MVTEHRGRGKAMAATWRHWVEQLDADSNGLLQFED